MKEIKIKNTYTHDLNTQYLGDLYVIKADAVGVFAEDVAAHWLDLYPTLELVTETKVIKEEVKEIKKK